MDKCVLGKASRAWSPPTFGPTMARSIIALLVGAAMVCGSAVHAQPDTSLTREFGHLSAKARARIAKQEQQDAAGDARYQAVMAEAEVLFQAKRYDESLDRFQAARTMRPLNVYPKVKIQDLQAFIAERNAAKAEVVRDSLRSLPVETTPAKEASTSTTAAPVVAEAQKEAIVVPPKKEPPITPTKQERPNTEAPKERLAMETSAPPPTDGLVERMYVEGRATVLERKLTRNGRVEVYRKVTHPWGQIVHFRDGVAISEREWAEVFQ